MTQADLIALLPKNKIDTERAKAIVALGFPAIEPILPELLEWMQDINWPVAQALRPWLARIGAPLAPYLKTIFETEDDVWKYYVLDCIVAHSAELQALLKQELERFAFQPTSGEHAEEVDIVAQEILAPNKT